MDAVLNNPEEKKTKPTTEERLQAVHERALTRFDEIQSALASERLLCLTDRRFYSVPGASWEGEPGADEEDSARPKYEFNKVHLSVIRIINEYRNNRVSVDFVPKDGTPNDEFADTCDGLYRADEKRCTADEAYDNAFEEGVGGGMGAWRLRVCNEDDEDDDNEHLQVSIEPIFDADQCVWFDLDAKRQDKADSKFCFVLTAMTRRAYEEEYDDDVTTWPTGVTTFDWNRADVVYVAEYYEVEEKAGRLYVFRGLDEKDMEVWGDEFKEDPEKRSELEAKGFRLVREKTVKRKKVHKYILSGGKMLSDEGLIAGRCIPIIPFYGKRWIVNSVERCMGHVRLAKDAQKLLNWLMSWLADMAARFDIEKPILTPEQVKGHAHMWAADALERYAYLLVNPILGPDGSTSVIGPQAYTRAPTIPPAMAGLMQLAEQSLQDLLGNQQAGEEIKPNISGKAVELIQNRLDMQTFIYLSNFAKSMKRSGEVWLSMMKDIATEKDRKMKTLESDGQVGQTVVNTLGIDKNGSAVPVNDFSKATFDVDVDVGPSSSSQRAATVRALTGLATITQDPEISHALILASLANIEGEGLTGLRKWGRAKSIQIGTVEPTDEEKQELAQQAQAQQPDPNATYLQAAAQEKIASAGLKQAQTAKTEAETQGEHQDQVINGAQAVSNAMNPPTQKPNPGTQ